jgi:hypothetical protein
MKRQIAEGIAIGTLHQSAAAVSDILEAHDAQRDQIEKTPWVESEKDRRRTALAEETRTKIDALVADTIRQAQRPLNDEEGRLRAAKTDADPNVVASIQVLQARAASAPDVAAALDVFEDAVFSSHGDVVRVVGATVLGRLRQLAEKDAGSPTSRAVAQFAALKDRFGRWTREHPTERERIQQIERERNHIATQILESTKFAMRLHGLNQPKPSVALRPVPETPPTRIRTGPAFDDVLRGGVPSDARR